MVYHPSTVSSPLDVARGALSGIERAGSNGERVPAQAGT